jgi:hypothetical protein
MRTSRQYFDLVLHYERAAQNASDWHSRQQLQTLADSYSVLAQSTVVLERSAEAFANFVSKDE